MHIVSITIEERKNKVPEVQKVLTEFGKDIISRLGIHNIGKNKNGLIIIVYGGKDIQDFLQKLSNIDDIEVKSMEIMEKL